MTLRGQRVLILGGTTEARQLATVLFSHPALDVISSLAGRTETPVLPVGRVRLGGFGGILGLVQYLEQERIQAVIDATHPFATRITEQAIAAAQRVQVPYLRVRRPAWDQVTGDQWYPVETHAAAAAQIPGLGQRIFLTIGRQEVGHYAQVAGWFLMRMVDPLSPGQPHPQGQILLQRGPFSLEEELTLIQAYQLDLMVSKNSGGEATYSKIAAARILGLPVIMIQPPPLPQCAQVTTIDQAWGWLQDQFSL